ncbi:MAG TPA: hypothetical protein VIF62_33520 [Labilithrix sp.]
MKRWEIGETRPSKSEWQRIVAYFASFLPREDTLELARVAGVDSPFASPPPVDVRAIESAIVRAADTLDVSPRRVRAALRDIAQAVANARGSLADLAKVVAEEQAAGEALRIIP